MSRYRVEEREAWRRWVTPKPLAGKPVHRWYVFPHSFTDDLVFALMDEWGIGKGNRILDPFAGAGTTILAAKERGIPATGYDLSPLAVLASRAKVANHDPAGIGKAWNRLQAVIEPARWNGAARTYPELVRKALPGDLLGAFDALLRNIEGLEGTGAERDFFRLALLAILPRFSRAVATGGWLSWVDKRARVSGILPALDRQVSLMRGDLSSLHPARRGGWRMEVADARALPDADGAYSAVITSPPYPNRHDYTRVFGVELMFAFLDKEKTQELRYQSFHSHPEAHPRRPEAMGYKRPKAFVRVLERVQKKTPESRIPRMLEGYFLDMFLALQEAVRICCRGARAAFVVGNARYCGEDILVDEWTAEIGEQAGFSCERIIAVRFRGNSAQQMGEFGRKPSRESVVVFRKRA